MPTECKPAEDNCKAAVEMALNPLSQQPSRKLPEEPPQPPQPPHQLQQREQAAQTSCGGGLLITSLFPKLFRRDPPPLMRDLMKEPLISDR